MTFSAETIRKLRAVGLTNEQLDAVLEIMETAKVSRKKREEKVPTGARGTRLPESWVLPRSWGEYALTLGFTQMETRHMAEVFKNYWLSASGSGAVKIDWFRTWQNWALKEASRLGKKPNPAIFTASDGGDQAAIGADQWEAILRVYHLTNKWNPDLGPPPGSVGCRVPPELLGQLH